MVGQILEYAAQASTWSPGDIELRAQRFLSSADCPDQYRRLSLEQAVRQFLERTDSSLREGFAYEAFMNSVTSNLERGRIRLIIAVDDPPAPLLATVQFVNRFSERFEMYLIQLKRFHDAARNQNVFVPALFGRVDRPVPRRWNEQTFVDQANRVNPSALAVLKQLIEFTTGQKALLWGRGRTIGTFTFAVGGPDDRRLPAFFVQSNGRMAFDFWTLGKWLPQELVDKYRQLLERAKGIPSEAISAPNWKEFDATALSSRDSWRAFKRAVVAFRHSVENLSR